MPTSGQFVAVWEYDDKIFSQTYRWDGPFLYKVHQGFPEFHPESVPPDQWDHISNIKYFSL